MSFRRMRGRWGLLVVAAMALLAALGRRGATDEETPTGPTPLGRFFQQLLPAPSDPLVMPADEEADDETPGKKKNGPANGDRTARDRIDARAPHDPQQAKRLQKAADLIRTAGKTGEDQDWRFAVEILQSVLERSEDSLIRRADGRWVSVRSQATRMLARLPQEYLAEYRRANDPVAKTLLEQARRDADLDALDTVATRFFLTDAGQQAADALATLHLDRGEFGIAAPWFARLLERESDLTRDPQWQLKAALAFRRAGDAVSLEKLELLRPNTAAPPVAVGKTALRPGDWLDAMQETAVAPSPPLGEWPMFLGTPRHTGTVAGGEPLLLPRWSQPLTYNRAVQDEVALLMQELSDAGTPTLPAFFPVLIDGKVIFRTLRGALVVDAVTGRPLWETRERLSPERILSGQTPGADDEEQRPGRWRAFPVGGMVGPFDAGGAEQHSLTRLLLEDGTFGLLSSDGRQLFVIEDQAVLLPRQPSYRWGWNAEAADPFHRDRSSNKIVAYDLTTGRPRWEVGGQAMDEPFDLRLAGHYFFGVPVPADDELLAVGEKDGEIRLFALNPDTGRPQWSQLVAYADAKIEQDHNRRAWPVQPAVGGGVIVVPTGVGWLVGIDRLSHSVLWACRYIPPKRTAEAENGFPGQYGTDSYSSLNATWGPSAPVIVGDRVLFTPPETFSPYDGNQQPMIVCLDLYAGKKLWQRDKGEMLYLAGIHDGRAVMVGADAVVSLSLDEGRPMWSLTIAPEAGRPSGRGLIAGDRLLLPLSSGQLWTVDLHEGTVAATAYLPDGATPLGNLGMYRGTLLSLGPAGITAFEQRDTVLKEIARRKARNPRDAWALLREADIRRLSHEDEAALTILRQIDPDRVPKDLRASYRQSMLETLASVIRSDYAAHEAELEQLERFAASDAERFLYRRVLAESLRAGEQGRAAFDLYLRMADDGGDQLIARDDAPTVNVTLPRWVAGQLAELWPTLSAEDQTSLEPEIDRRADTARDGDADVQERFVTLFAFHPSAVPVERQLAERAASDRALVRAESRLLALSHHADKQIAAAALVRLAALMDEFDLPGDAAHYADLVVRRFPDVELTDRDGLNKPIKECVAPWRDLRHRRAERLDVPSWGTSDLSIAATATQHSSNPVHELRPVLYQMPSLRQFRFLYYQNTNRLGMLGGTDDRLHWLLPLRTSNRHGGGGQIDAQDVNHTLLVLHGDVLHALSPLTRQILWTTALDGHTAEGFGYYEMQHLLGMQPLQQGSSALSNRQAGTDPGLGTAVPVANERYVCTAGRRSFQVRDAATGAVWWICDRLPPHARIYGTRDLLLIDPLDGTDIRVLRATDGKPLDVPKIRERLADTMFVSPDGLLLSEQNQAASLFGLIPPKSTVRLCDPLTGRDLWEKKVMYPAGAHFSILNDGRLAVAELSGKLHLVEIASGRSEDYAGLDARTFWAHEEMALLADDERLFLIVNRNNPMYYGYSSNALQSLTVNGTIYAFDRGTREKLWSRRITGRQLLLEQFTHLPLLVFTTHKYEEQDIFHYWSAHLLALDKQTGRVRGRTELTNGTGYHFYAMTVSQADRSLELLTYNQRVRFSADPADEPPIRAPQPPAAKD